jgi:cobalt-zinc-cadmium efflux system protein
MVVEAVAGFWTGALALLADAGHMATDALGLGMALAAIAVADRVQGRSRTFGLYRLEVLAAFLNALLLFGVAGYVLFEAAGRLGAPPDVAAIPMLLVATGGLAINLISWRLLRVGAKESINIEGALLEVLADLVGSIGAVSAALLIRFADWGLADPLFGAAVGIFVIPRAWRLASKAIRILVQAAPPHIDIDDLTAALAAISGVLEVHDVHVWTLTSDMDVASAHLRIENRTEEMRILSDARDVVKQHSGISHVTIQVESGAPGFCRESAW